MAKAKQRFSWTYNHEAAIAKVIDSVTKNEALYSFAELPETIRDQVAVYGLGKVLQDRNSGVDADAKMDGMTKTYESLSSGQWKADKVMGARFLSPVIEAIGKRKGCSVSAAQAAYRALDDTQKIALKEALAEDIQAIVDARAAAEEVDVSDLLG